jgi:hypothetical protein
MKITALRTTKPTKTQRNRFRPGPISINANRNAVCRRSRPARLRRNTPSSEGHERAKVVMAAKRPDFRAECAWEGLN